MKRRKALKTLGITIGSGVLIPSFSGCDSDDYHPLFFAKEDIDLIHEIAETILPSTTDSPGAKELKVAHFIDKYVYDCYSPENQKKLQNGLKMIEEECIEKEHKQFFQLSELNKIEILEKYDTEAKANTTNHYFTLLKSLILFTYFTSKEGMEIALNYLPVPGKYVGNYPIDSSTKSWAL